MKKDDCIFCKIANGEIPSRTLYEDEKFRVILDLGPVTRGHALLLPKDHASDLFELPEEIVSAVLTVAKKVAANMKEKLHFEGMNRIAAMRTHVLFFFTCQENANDCTNKNNRRYSDKQPFE